MLVKIDSREKNRIKQATQYFKEQGLEVTVEELEVGDYIFTDGNDSVVFEFKLVADFIASIQDGRVFNQCIEQSENFNHHFCIIHGDLATRSKCIAMTKHYRQVIVKKFPRKEKNPAFNWLCYCCYGINHKRASDIVKNLNLKTMEDLLYLDYDKLTSIDGIGSKMANRILDTISDDSYDQY